MSRRLIEAYEHIRAIYTASHAVVPQFESTRSNLSEASLNLQMLEMLDLSPNLSVADLGSGCGITANAMALFGARVTGIEFHAASVDVAREYAGKAGLGQDNPIFLVGAVNEKLGEDRFDRLHGGYMMSEENARKYCEKNLKNSGVAVLNVGEGNWGDVVVFKKDGSDVKRQNTGINVIFQEDARP